MTSNVPLQIAPLPTSTRSLGFSEFRKTCSVLGCSQGFLHFAACTTGREELLVSVRGRNNESAAQPRTKVEGPVFLLGFYTRYQAPLVWPCNEISRQYFPSADPSIPLQLSCLAKWKSEGYTVRPHEVIEELVRATSGGNQPKNPFEIDRIALQSLPLYQRALQTGSLCYVLGEVIRWDPPYADIVFHDVQWLSELHFSLMKQWLGVQD